MSSLEPVLETPVPLESYAAVVAALGAGLPLVRALDLADVRPADWDAASDRWQAAIDESAASDLAVLVAFDAALLNAKRRFEPTVEPIESDAHAWAMFRRHFVTAVDAAAFVADKGLSFSVYARIEADWVNKLAADEALAAAFARHTEAPLDECPSLTLTPPALLRADEGRSSAPSGEAAPSVPVGAIPSVPVGAIPSVPVSAVANVPVGAIPSVPVDAVPGVPFSSVPAIPPPNVAISAKPAPVPALGSTGELPKDLIAKIARGPLPFGKPPAGAPAAGGPPPAAGAPPPAAGAPPAKAPSASPPSGAPPAKASPAKAPSAPAAGAAPPGKAPSAPPAAAVLSQTGALPADLMLQIAKGTLPFAKSKAPAAAHAPDDPPTDAPVTSPVPKLPPPGKELPFRAPAAAQPAAAAETPLQAAAAATPPQAVPAAPARQAPSGTPAQKAPAAQTSSAAAAPQGSSDAPAPVPALTIEQYASLCAEIAVFPGTTDAIFLRYGLSSLRERLAVDLAWRERLRRNPQEYRDWQDLYKRYQTYWTEQSRRGPAT